MTPALTSALLGVLLVNVAIGQGQKCQPALQRAADQETYVGLTDRVYAYVPRIESAGGGWKPFTVRILVGSFRRPFLLPKAFMNEADLMKLLAGRSDIKQSSLTVPGFDPKKGGTPALNTVVTVPDGNTAARLTIRIARVVSGSYASTVVFDVCVTKG